MRIAFVYDGIYPFAIGGLSKRIHDIAKKPSERGHDVYLYGTRLWNDPDTLLYDGFFIRGICPMVKRYTGEKRTIPAALVFASGTLKALAKDGPFDIEDSGMASISPLPP